MAIPLRTGFEEASYIVYEKDKGSYYAKDGRTGDIAYGGPNNVGGVSGADAAAVLAAAVAACPTRGVIAFKEGTYTLSTKTTINKTLTLRLTHAILVFGAAITLFDINATQVRVQGGTIQGGNLAGQVAFNLLTGSNGVLFEDVRFDHVYRPFYLNGSIWELRIYGCWIDSCYRGVESDATSTDINLNMRDTWINHTDDDAVRIYKHNGVLIHNCEIMNTGSDGINILSRYGGDVWITATELDVIGFQGIVIGNDIPDVHLIGVYINAVDNSVKIGDGSGNFHIVACHIASSGVAHAIYLGGTYTQSGRVIGNVVNSAGGTNSITIEGPRNCLFSGNMCATPIVELSGDYNVFTDNKVSSMTLSGTNQRARNNVGYVNENRGIAVMAAGGLITVTHHMDQIPVVIHVTAQGDLGDVYVPGGDTITVTGFTIVADTPVAGVSVFWEAYAKSTGMYW